MNPFFYLKIFAWISIVGFGCSFFMEYWIPILFGSALFTYLVHKLAAKKAELRGYLRPSAVRREPHDHE